MTWLPLENYFRFFSIWYFNVIILNYCTPLESREAGYVSYGVQIYNFLELVILPSNLFMRVLHQFTLHLCVDVAFILHRSNFFSDFFSCITSAPIPFFHRCAPVNISCYTKFAEALITFVSDSSILHRLISGVMTCKEIILGLCLLSLVLSMILMVIIRYISRVLVWILTIVVVLGSLGGTGVLWWLYVKMWKSPNDSLTVEQLQIAKDNRQALLIYAIAATIFTVIFLLIMLVMRKRVALTIALFHVAGKVFIHLPLLVFQPFWTFFALILFWIYWIMVLLFLGITGSAVPNEQGLVEFRITGPLKYMWWYHVVGLVWISEFILACQQMTVAGAVVTYYFTREKRNLPFTPILASVNRLICYHLGTVAKGSFIITLVKIPRMILMYIHSQVKGKENVCARCILKACICCLWCLEKCLTYLNQNAYTATAINSTNFCTSAKDAFVILVENALRVAAINTVGDFMLFLGKVGLSGKKCQESSQNSLVSKAIRML
uniref:Choline transporter-like protein n=1 Tax=Laticauda laticaudata TaxID=8630 RepID=A0A8C5SM52_LATLA